MVIARNYEQRGGCCDGSDKCEAWGGHVLQGWWLISLAESWVKEFVSVCKDDKFLITI